MNLLVIADPSSTHDLKWISSISSHEIHLVRRHIHPAIQNNQIKNLQEHGSIHDFSILRPLRLLKTILFLKKLISRYKIDLMHIYYAEPNILWAICKPFFGVPIILTTRGTDVLKTIPDHFKSFSFSNLYVRQLYRNAFQKCDAITCTSKSQIKSITENFKTVRPILIRTGINIPTRSYEISELPIELQNKKFVLMPRVMKPIYNHEFTIGAIAMLPINITSEFIFVFLDCHSQNQEYVQGLQNLMKEHDNITFLFLPAQNQHELYALYKYAHLVIMNPHSDGSPVSGLEAMFFECPLILGPLEYDKDLFGEWVFRIKQWDMSELMETITTVLGHDNSERLKKGKQIVLRDGDTKIEMKKVDDLYSSTRKDNKNETKE